MIYASVCSGIESATVAWHPLGWRPAFFAEIDAFPSAVLAHHYPQVPNLGDITKFSEWPDADFDVLVGGTPCQSFSVAGLRKGMADPRGNLALTYLGIAARYRPAWLAWENVPGVLSVDGGRAFASFLGGLAKLGYGFAYRVLDAQFFNLAQRRARVFVVASLRGWQCAAAVLFERSCLSGHPAPSREAGSRVAATITRGADSSGKGGYVGRRQEDDYNIVATALTARAAKGPDSDCTTTLVAHALRGEGFDASEDGTGRGTPLVPIAFNARQDPDAWLERTGPLDTDGTTQAIAIQAGALRENPASGPDGIGVQKNLAYTIEARAEVQAVQRGSAVRRLTPRECERLQGFEDDYTLIPYRGKPAKDGPRYKALGNSKAVPVVRWIGERIAAVDVL